MTNAPEEELPSDALIGRFTLRFIDRTVEREFLTDDLRRVLPVVRLSLLAGFCLYASFGLLDAYVAGPLKETLWLIRYGGVCPVLLAGFLLSFSRCFIPLAQGILATYMFVAGIGIVAMTVVTPIDIAAPYYAGLLLVVMYCANLIRLRWIYAAGVTITTFGLYQLSASWLNPIPLDVLVRNDAFLGTSVALGIYTDYIQEFHQRRDFASTRAARAAKARSDELLTRTEGASRAKSDFLAMMSHELRTPLNAIIGFADIMRRRMFGPIGSERYVSYTDDIFQSGTHLLNVINDILDLSKAEAGKLTLFEENVDFCELIDQCLRLIRERAIEAGVQLRFQRPTKPPLLRADARLMKQMVLNVVSNAVKFTLSGGSVLVCLEPAACSDALTFRVADTGIGIAADDLNRVVEPFVQVESSLSRRQGGTGLGLPLVKKIAELHGGHFAITSSLGVGTTIAITFPTDRVVRQAEFELGMA